MRIAVSSNPVARTLMRFILSTSPRARAGYVLVAALRPGTKRPRAQTDRSWDAPRPPSDPHNSAVSEPPALATTDGGRPHDPWGDRFGCTACVAYRKLRGAGFARKCRTATM